MENALRHFIAADIHHRSGSVFMYSVCRNKYIPLPRLIFFVGISEEHLHAPEKGSEKIDTRQGKVVEVKRCVCWSTIYRNRSGARKIVILN